MPMNTPSTKSNRPSPPAATLAEPEPFRRVTSRLPLNELRDAAAAARREGGEPIRKGASTQILALVASWAAVMLPLAWGVAETLRKTAALFQ